MVGNTHTRTHMVRAAECRPYTRTVDLSAWYNEIMYKKHMYSRKPNRMRGFDYGDSRCYFITVCATKKYELFGEINNKEMHLSDLGKIVADEIPNIALTYPCVHVLSNVVMPNHVHIIIKIGIDSPSISQVMNQWKRAISIKAGFSPWQKSFHDHIIRDEVGFTKITEYIKNNIANWDGDCFHPKNKSTVLV